MKMYANKTSAGGRRVFVDSDHTYLDLAIDPAGKIVSYDFQPRTPPSERSAPVRPDVETQTDAGCGSCAGHFKNALRYLRGAVGLAKAQLGFDPASTQTVQHRKSACLGCEHYDFGTCGQCGCWLAKKILIDHESCPMGRW